MSSTEDVSIRLKPLGMPPRVAVVVDNANVLETYLQNNKPAYLGPENLSIEDVALTTVAVSEASKRLTKLSHIMTAMAVELDPSMEKSHLNTIATENPKGEITAVSITSAMEQTRLSLHMIGRAIFSQYTKIMTSKSLALGHSSNAIALKGIELNMDVYMIELSFLANALSNHVPYSNGNEGIDVALALTNMKKTREAVECLEMMSATYLYILTHALSLLIIHHAFLIHATPAILKITANYFNAALVDEDQLLRDDDLLFDLQDRVLAHVLEHIPLTAHLDNCVRWSTVAVGAAGVVTAFLASHAGRVTYDFNVLGAVDGWIGSMGDVLSRLWKKARGVDLESDGAFGDEGVQRMYAFVRQELGILFDASGKGDVGEKVEVICEAIREGRFEGVCS